MTFVIERALKTDPGGRSFYRVMLGRQSSSAEAHIKGRGGIRCEGGPRKALVILKIDNNYFEDA
jgi:hypothetical protein